MVRVLDFRLVSALCLVVAAAGCGGSASTPGPAAPSAQVTVSSVAVSGTASLTAAGQTGQLAAMATMSDGTTQNVTSSATWQSSNQSAITVSSSGMATAVASGTATITATAQSKSGTLAMTVAIPAVTSFEGTLAGSRQSGTFAVTVQTVMSATGAPASRIQPLGVGTASGTLTLNNGGGTSTLTGTFDTSTNALSLSGGGFVLTGTVAQAAASGTYTGPGGTSGGFAGLDSTRNAITTMCGSYSGLNGTGIWNLQFSANGKASGVTRPDLSARDPQPRTTGLTGQLTGTALLLVSTEDGLTANGIVQGASVSGSYGGLEPGTFSGSISGCR